jgi:hypothetical protein
MAVRELLSGRKLKLYFTGLGIDRDDFAAKKLGSRRHFFQMI